jgi:hypothetical protein
MNWNRILDIVGAIGLALVALGAILMGIAHLGRMMFG